MGSKMIFEWKPRSLLAWEQCMQQLLLLTFWNFSVVFGTSFQTYTQMEQQLHNRGDKGGICPPPWNFRFK